MEKVSYHLQRNKLNNDPNEEKIKPEQNDSRGVQGLQYDKNTV